MTFCMFFTCLTECKAGAEVLYKFVDGLGSTAFVNAQRVACICVPEDHQDRLAGLALLGVFLAGLLVVFLLWASIFFLRKRGFL